jgi:hypothetical protein
LTKLLGHDPVADENKTDRCKYAEHRQPKRCETLAARQGFAVVLTRRGPAMH